MENFIFIKENVQAEIVEKKSKFICNLIKVDSQEEAEDIIKKFRKKYYDARHNCIAYRVLENENILEKSSDDGEPSGTAGAPMLNILQKNNLCNVVAIVTRYFGGILLGTGGLVRAYSEVIKKAIELSEFLQKCQGLEAVAKLKYSNLENFKYYCKKNNITIKNVEYGEIIVVNIELEKDEKDKIIADIEQKNINILEISDFRKKIIDKSI